MKDMVRLLEAADIQLIDPAEARARWFAYRLNHGYVTERPLLSTDTENMKFAKSAKKGTRTYGLALAPAKTSNIYNVCRYATPACAASCVAHSGHGRWDKVKDARLVKTGFLADDPSAFLTILTDEIDKIVARHGEAAVRLNTFSDLPWERYAPWLFERWGDAITFYDYTKWPSTDRPEVPGYDLTRSATERQTNKEIAAMLAAGERVAVCLDIKKKDAVPETYLGFPMVDGDQSDARFLEPKGTAVLLRPKGSARGNGFARPHIT